MNSSRINIIGQNGNDGEHYKGMRTIIAGSRDIVDKFVLDEALCQVPWNITEVISGGARGVDRLGEDFSQSINIPLTVFKADWDRYGKSAGYKRNIQMAENAEALLALWDGKSKGTKHMIDIAKKHKLKIYIMELK